MNEAAVCSGELAVEGGAPSCRRALPGWPVFAEDEVEAAASVLRSGRVSYWTGHECVTFEREFAAHVGTRHAIALANGTLALELSLRALGIGPGDEVIVPSRTFIASASCVVAVGATPVVVDVDRDSGNLTPETVAPALGPRTRAIVAVHLAGWPCDMPRLVRFAREHGLRVVEDCAQAHGARIEGRAVGSFGDCAAYSFCQDKIMTTGGEGGMLVTSDDALWECAWSFKDHGKNHAAVRAVQSKPGFRWVHQCFGSNYRLTEMQAAIGRCQLRKLDAWAKRRRLNAERLLDAFSGLDALRVPVPPAGFGHAWYKFYAYLVPSRLRPGWGQSRILQAVAAEGVPCFSGSCSEIYREQAFTAAGLGPSEPLPVASELGETSLMLQVHPTLGDEDMIEVAAAVTKVLRAASR